MYDILLTPTAQAKSLRQFIARRGQKASTALLRKRLLGDFTAPKFLVLGVHTRLPTTGAWIEGAGMQHRYM